MKMFGVMTSDLEKESHMIDMANSWMNEWMNKYVWGNGNENGNGNDSISEWNSLEPLTIRIKRLKLIDIVYYTKEKLKII